MIRSIQLPLAALAIVLSVQAHAASRPDSLSMTCAEVQATVARQGAVVVGTGPYVYDRFVSDARFCTPTQIARQSFIRTRDVQSCLVYTCRDRTLSWQP